MEARTLTLNLVPGGVLPRINVSQYDTGVPVTATLYDGDTLYTIPTGAQVYVQGRKHDNTLYQYQCGTSGSIVTFATTTQMTMVAGENIAEISIHYNGTIVGTINFVIYVEESALQDPTQSSIDDIPVIADLPEIVEEVREDVENAEAWAVGTRQGVPVPDTDETYHNNSKYYAEYAEDVVSQISLDVEKIEQSVIKAATSANLAAFAATSAQNASLIATSAQAAAAFYAGEAEESARLAELWSENPPYIGANGNWWVYDVDTEQFVDSGIDASITMQIADITMLAPTATPYVTNSGTSTDAVFHMGIPRGETGSGVASVQKISSEGRVDTYRMTFTDGTYFDYTVTNGADGTGSVSTVNHIEPVGGNVQLKVTDLDVIGSAGQVVGLTSTNTLGIFNIPSASDMTGATASTPGTHGFVPAPAAGDQNKVLKGDGTWGNVSGGHVVLTSTGAVMPQRSKLKFLNSDLTDDELNDTTIVSPRGGGAVIKIGDVEGASVNSTAGTASVVLKWTDPEDIVVSGATLAEWAGTKVIRKAGSAPTSVSDGTVVIDSTTKNAYSSTGYTDSGLTYGTTYYYRFFPYTTQGAVTDGSSVNATPDRESVAVPTFDATMTYDGTQQTATFTGYDSTKMTVSGNTGTDAGSYTAKFNVKDDYKWSDGTREEKSVTWSIGKAAGSVTLSSNSVTLDADHTSVTVTASNATGTLSVQSSASTVATASVSGNTITINSVNNTTGSATITVNVAASANYLAATATIAVTASFATLVSWTSGTDAQIQAMIDAYYAGTFSLDDIKSVWSIGQNRSVSLSAMSATGVGESHATQSKSLTIIDFDHDELVSAINGKTKALISTRMSSLNEQGYMNPTDTNTGGWDNCARRTWCNSTFRNALPMYLKNLNKQVKKKTSNGGSSLESSSIITSNDYVFLVSTKEEYGMTAPGISNTKDGEGTIYKHYETRSNVPTSVYIWERSPSWRTDVTTNNGKVFQCTGYSTGAWGSGASAGEVASALKYIAPAMCF